MLDPHPEMLKTGNHIIKKTARGFFSSLLEQIAFNWNRFASPMEHENPLWLFDVERVGTRHHSPETRARGAWRKPRPLPDLVSNLKTIDTFLLPRFGGERRVRE
jgi:hypothetical protein